MKVILTIQVPKSTIDPFKYVIDGIKQNRYKMIGYKENTRHVEIILKEEPK